jgi:hypothetical protein
MGVVIVSNGYTGKSAGISTRLTNWAIGVYYESCPWPVGRQKFLRRPDQINFCPPTTG